MNLTEAQLMTTITNLLWPFIRIAALCMVVPVFGNRMIPIRIRLFFAVAISSVIVTSLTNTVNIDPLSVAGLYMTIKQIVLGVMMGFIFVMVFQSFVVSAQIISMQSGLGFATLVDPAGGGSVPLVGQFFTLLATLLFLGLNGHLAVIEMLSKSFTTMPLSSDFPIDNLWLLVSFLSWTFQSAIYISLPVIISLLVVNISFAILTRAAPQLNIFAIGFPITLTLSLLLIYINLTGFQFHFNLGLEHGFNLLSIISRS